MIRQVVAGAVLVSLDWFWAQTLPANVWQRAYERRAWATVAEQKRAAWWS